MHGESIWEKHAHTNPGSTQKLLHHLAAFQRSQRTKRLEACGRRSLKAAQGVGSAGGGYPERKLGAHRSAGQKRTRGRGPKFAGAHGAALSAAPEPRVLRPLTYTFSPSPTVRGSPRRGAPLRLQTSPAEGRLLSFPAGVPPTAPGCRAALGSLRFLQTPQRTRPPLPPPALGLQVNEMLVFLSHLFCFPAKF